MDCIFPVDFLRNRVKIVAHLFSVLHLPKKMSFLRENGCTQISQPFPDDASSILSFFTNIEYFDFFVQVEPICGPELLKTFLEDIFPVNN